MISEKNKPDLILQYHKEILHPPKHSLFLIFDYRATAYAKTSENRKLKIRKEQRDLNCKKESENLFVGERRSDMIVIDSIIKLCQINRFSILRRSAAYWTNKRNQRNSVERNLFQGWWRYESRIRLIYWLRESDFFHRGREISKYFIKIYLILSIYLFHDHIPSLSLYLKKIMLSSHLLVCLFNDISTFVGYLKPKTSL